QPHRLPSDFPVSLQFPGGRARATKDSGTRRLPQKSISVVLETGRSRRSLPAQHERQGPGCCFRPAVSRADGRGSAFPRRRRISRARPRRRGRRSPMRQACMSEGNHMPLPACSMLPSALPSNPNVCSVLKPKNIKDQISPTSHNKYICEVNVGNQIKCVHATLHYLTRYISLVHSYTSTAFCVATHDRIKTQIH
ncbi:unnamed protein product, partial [Ixodes pacificus]